MIAKEKRQQSVRSSILEYEKTKQYWRCLATDYFDGEEWKGVIGWEDKYEVSNLGRLRSVRRNGSINRKMNEPYILKQFIGTTGYLNLQLRDEGRSKRLKMHRAVAEAFNPNPLKLKVVNHLDWNKLNNVPHNLEWSTKRNDILHAFNNGLIGRGEKSHEATITNETALSIFNAEGRYEEISKKYGVSKGMVASIKNGLSWASVTGKKREPKNRKKLTKDQAIKILLDKRSPIVIAKEMDLSGQTVRKVKRGEMYKEFTSEFKKLYVPSLRKIRFSYGK